MLCSMGPDTLADPWGSTAPWREKQEEPDPAAGHWGCSLGKGETSGLCCQGSCSISTTLNIERANSADTQDRNPSITWEGHCSQRTGGGALLLLFAFQTPERITIYYAVIPIGWWVRERWASPSLVLSMVIRKTPEKKQLPWSSCVQTP